MLALKQTPNDKCKWQKNRKGRSDVIAKSSSSPKNNKEQQSPTEAAIKPENPEWNKK